MAFIRSVGIAQSVRYSFCQNPIALEADFMHFLHSIKPITSRYPSWHDNTKLFPQIMNDWLTGTMSTAKIIKAVEDALPHYTECTATQAMFKAVARCMFDPHIFADTITIDTEDIAFVHHCKQLGHQLYILSNWDSASFAIFAQKYPWFIDLFDGIVISGEVGHAKPDPLIYEYLLAKYAIDRADAVFIDDIQHNIDAAQEQDIFSIQCKQYACLGSRSAYFPYVKDMFKLWTDAQYSKICTPDAA